MNFFATKGGGNTWVIWVAVFILIGSLIFPFLIFQYLRETAGEKQEDSIGGRVIYDPDPFSDSIAGKKQAVPGGDGAPLGTSSPTKYQQSKTVESVAADIAKEHNARKMTDEMTLSSTAEARGKHIIFQ